MKTPSPVLYFRHATCARRMRRCSPDGAGAHSAGRRSTCRLAKAAPASASAANRAGVACPVTSVDSRIDWASLHIYGGSGIGRGPAYPATGPTAQLTVQTDTQHGGPWLTTKLFWYVRPRYRGPVLIRGRQLDGTHRGWASTAARFRAGSSVSTSARRSDGPVSRRTREACRPTSAHSFRVVTASRIDGTRFSRIVIFRVTD